VAYFYLAILWILWCALHSALISIPVTRFLRKHAGSGFRFFRLFYNILALSTLVPIILYGAALGGPVLFRWDGGLRVLQIALILAVLLLFWAGARNYDFMQFLGLRQLTGDSRHQALSSTGRLQRSGILAATRHPWYLAALIFIWVDYVGLTPDRLIANIVLSAYLIIGTLLEERKLVLEFGADYRQYQKEVSMLIPLKYLREKLRI
jgi:protein-S-isoprenylcysteine O-methyltransferase Ste14